MNDTETLAVQRYFQAHGLKVAAPEELNAALKIAIGQLEAAVHGPSRSELTRAETAMLERAGVDLDEHPDQTDPMLDYANEFAAILATSLTPSVVAQTLGVTPVRVRQMIRDRSLYAIRIEGRWQVPLYQLSSDALVPNIGRINQAIAELDPVSVQRWITTPDSDLEGLTPLNWLKAGRDLSAVLQVVPEP